MKPLISIIITTKNEEKNIHSCLKSIASQNRHISREIILVDNHSFDQTVKIAKPFVSKIIIAGPERSTQRNIGAKYASGNWLLFLDADMILTKNALDQCISLLGKNQQQIIIALKEEAKGSSFLGKAMALERNCYQEIPWLLAARFFPRQLFLKVGGYDKNLIAGEDWDLSLRLIEKNSLLKLTPKVTIIHHEPTDSLNTLLKKELYYIKHINLYRQKHPWEFQKQQSITARCAVWLKCGPKLIRHPILTCAFLIYKLMVYFMWQINLKTQISNIKTKTKNRKTYYALKHKNTRT